MMWGWLQVDEIIAVDTCHTRKLAWAVYHPHFHRAPDKTNTVYIAKTCLDIPGIEQNTIKGAGVFTHVADTLQLTSTTSKKPSCWQLPDWFYPVGKQSSLTYHSDVTRWEKRHDHVLLNSVGRGQEFILNCSHYPDAIEWVNRLLHHKPTLR